MQSSSENSTRILDYIKKVDNNNLSQFKEKLSCVYDQMPSLSNEKLNDVKKDTEELKNIFEKNKQNYVKKTSISEYERVHQDFNVIIQCIEFLKASRDPDWRKS